MKISERKGKNVDRYHLSVLICDDDLYFSQRFAAQIAEIAEKKNIDTTIEIVESGNKLLFYLDTKYAKSDLIFLDYHMMGLNGVETAKELRRHGVAADIVFCTMDDSHMLDGYDVEAMYYIVKGQTDEAKLEELVEKAVNHGKNRDVELLSLACAGDHRNIPVRDILYFEVKQRIVTVHYYKDQQEETFEFYSTLSKIDECLYDKGFVRIHASYLVATKYIYRRTKREVELVSGERLPVGRSYQARLEQAEHDIRVPEGAII
jgi:DNA-binding LytR/AlgR family response regulator